MAGGEHDAEADTLLRPALARLLPDGECDFAEVQPECYVLEREFARGGLGRILRATDRRLRRRVALKELISKDDKAEQRFVREALITARLEHPGIVPVHEAGRWPSGKRFYAMKLVEGRTLSQALEVASSVEERLALVSHLIDVADAVAYAHSQGILHRDLKPANVMVGAFGETVVIDWGLAKDLRDRSGGEPGSDGPLEPVALTPPDPNMTTEGLVVGTPPYMPPEQAGGYPVDERSDVYALGAMLYHALCGRRPYAEVRAKDILVAVVSGPPKPLRSLAPDVPIDLVAIADKAMAREPDDRYPSAKEMAAELRRFSTGQLVGAYRYNPRELLWRFVRRNFGAVMVGLVALLVLVAAGGFGVERIRRERNAAMAAEAETARRNQALILSQAELNLDRDPTLSLAWLKELERPIPGAASVAAEAVARGVASRIVTGHLEEVDVVAASRSGERVASGDRAGGVRWLDVPSGVARALAGHTDRVTSLRFSPDESQLASASYDETVRVWDLADGAHRVVARHAADVTDVAWVGPEALVSISVDGELRLTDVQTGATQWAVRSKDVNRHLVVRVAADGRRIVSGGHGGRARWWAVADGALLHEVECDSAGEVTALELSAGRLVCGGRDGVLRVFENASSTPKTLVGHDAALESLAVSPDGQEAVSSDVAGGVARWRLDDGTPRWLEPERGRVASAAFGRDGGQFALGGWDGEVHLFRSDALPPVTLRGHGGRVSALAGLAGGALISGSWDRQMRLWSVPEPSSRVFEGHTVGVHAVDVSPDGRRVASGGHDDTVRIWDVATGRERVLRGHTDHVFRVLFSPDGQWVASSSDDQTVRLWSVDGKTQRVLRGHRADVEELAFSSDGAWLASAGEDDRAWLWSVQTGEGRALEGHTDHVTGVAFRPGRAELASAGRDGRVLVWPVGGGPARELARSEAEVGSVAYSADGVSLAAAFHDGRVLVFDAESGEVAVRYEGLEQASLVRFSADGRYLAVGSRSTALWLCLRSYRRCTRLPDHDGDIRDLAFDKEGVVLVSAAAGDGDNLRLWDTRTEEYRSLRGHRFDVFSVAVFPSGGAVASGSGDADVRLWPVRLPPDPDDLEGYLRAQTAATVPPKAAPSEIVPATSGVTP